MDILPLYLHGFIHPRWYRMSSINSLFASNNTHPSLSLPHHVAPPFHLPDPWARISVFNGSASILNNIPSAFWTRTRDYFPSTHRCGGLIFWRLEGVLFFWVGSSWFSVRHCKTHNNQQCLVRWFLLSKVPSSSSIHLLAKITLKTLRLLRAFWRICDREKSTFWAEKRAHAPEKKT